MKILLFLQRVYSEKDGTPSSSRWQTGKIIDAAIFWVTYLVIKNHAIPDLGGISLLVGTVAALNYGTNQLAARFSPQNPPNAPPANPPQ